MKEKQCKAIRSSISKNRFNGRRCQSKVFVDGLCFTHWTKRNKEKNKDKR